MDDVIVVIVLQVVKLQKPMLALTGGHFSNNF